MRRLFPRFALFLLILALASGCGSARHGVSENKRDYDSRVADLPVDDWQVNALDAVKAENEGQYKRTSELVETAILLLARKYDEKSLAPGEDLDLVGARGEALLEKFAHLADKVYEYDNFTHFLEHVQNRMTPAFQARAKNYLSAGYWSTHDLPRAQFTWDKMNFITDWQVVGPFDNERGDGFERAFEPETTIDLAGHYRGKEREIGWRRLQVKPNFGSIDLHSVMRPNEESLAYALTWLRVDKDTPAALQWGSDESAAIWINDGKVYSRDIERSGRFDQDIVPIKLFKGWNKVLVKTTTQQYGWSFSVRLTDLAGQPLPVTVSADEALAREPKYRAYAEGDLTEIKTYTPARSADEVFNDENFTSRALPAIDFYLAGYYLHNTGGHDVNDHPDRACAEKALQLQPGQSGFHLLHADTLQVRSAVAVEQEHNPYRAALETSLEHSSRNAEAHQLLAEYYLGTVGNVDKALYHADRALTINPEYADAQLTRARAYGAKGFAQEAYRQFAAIERRFPDHIGAIEAYSFTLLTLDRVHECIDLLKRALKIDSSLNRDRIRLVGLYNRLGLVDEALGGHLEVLAYDPYAIESHQYRARIFASRDQFDRAVAECEDALKVRPDDAQLIEEAAHYYFELGDSDTAFAYWERSLEIFPNNNTLREYLQFLQEDRQTLADLFPEDGAKIAAEGISLEQAQAEYPNEPVVFLLRKQVSKLNDDGTTRYLVHEILRVLTDRGIELLDRYGARGFGASGRDIQFLIARVHKADGTLDARVGRGWAVDLPTLRVGDVVEVQYMVDVKEKGVFGDYFGEAFYFGLPTPVQRSVYVLAAPPDRKLFFHYRNIPETKPVVETLADQNLLVRTWTVNDPGKIKNEPNMPDLDEVAPQVQVSTYASWDEFAAWYWNLIRKQLVCSEDMKQTVRDLVKDCRTEEEKIRAIYNFVVTKITYNDEWEFGVHGYKPYNAQTIFERKRGDCKDKAILINTLLNEVGVKAYPVLIAMAQGARSEEDLSLPLINHFNHCISCVPGKGENGGDLFLDGTATYSSMDAFPDYDQGATVLVVREDAGKVTTIPINGHSKDNTEETARLVVAPDGAGLLSTSINVSGSVSYAYRTTFQVDELKREQWENIYGREFSGARVEGDPTYSDLSDLNRPVHVELSLRLPTFARAVGDGLRFKANRAPLRNNFGWKAHLSAPWTDLYARNADRAQDIVLPSPWSHHTKLEVILPEGWTVTALPESVDLNIDEASFKITYVKTELGYTVEKWIASKATRVEAEHYDAFREFCIALDKAEREELEIQPAK